MLLPFCNKAFHIDDPIFLWPAKQILAGNPYPLRAPANWYGWTATLAEVTNHSPFVSWLMVPVVSLAGWSEIALHVEFAFIAAAAIVGCFFLARHFCSKPFSAAIILLVSPAFFVSATTVMSDVTMQCFWIWSLVTWLHARKFDRPALFLLAGLLMSAAAMSKYPGIFLVPLLAASFLSRRRLPWQIIALILPVATILALEYLTRKNDGVGIVSTAIFYANRQPDRLASLPSHLFTALNFTGGCFLAIPIVWCTTWNSRQAMIALALALTLAVLLGFLPDRILPLFPIAEPERNLIGWHGLIFSLAGLLLLWMPLSQLITRRDRESLFLTLWVFGIFIFAGIVNWTINARSVLPMGPAVAILAMRSLEKRSVSHAFDWRIGGPALFSAALSILLAVADTQFASASRDAAELIHARARTFHRTMWFTGHWGFQWYMEQNGAFPIDYDTSLLQAGDLFVEPSLNTNSLPLPMSALQPIDHFDNPLFPAISTCNPSCGAMFYASAIGPLPYAFGPILPQNFTVYRVIQNILPPKQPATSPATSFSTR